MTNDDDRVREHLANERTYLAWLRTGISTMGLGIVIAKLRWLFPAAALASSQEKLVHASQIGLYFSLIGLTMVVMSAIRFVFIRKQIRNHSYIAGGLIPILVGGSIVIVGLVIFLYLLNS